MWGGFRDRKMENALAEILYILNTQLACKQNDVSLKMGEKTYKRSQATASIVFSRPTRRKTWPATRGGKNKDQTDLIGKQGKGNKVF